MKEFESKNNENKNNENESQNVEKIIIKNNNDNQQQQQDILLTPKKRKLPLFSAFTKNDLFDLISNFVLDGQFNNWEMINLLTCLTDLGTALHDMKRVQFFLFMNFTILFCRFAFFLFIFSIIFYTYTTHSMLFFTFFSIDHIIRY